MVLKTCKTTCCRIFETNMRLRPRHLLSRVPKTTSRFNDSLEGFTELRQAIIPTDHGYYRERIQIKISKGEKHMEQKPRENRCKAPRGPLPGKLHGRQLILPAMMCDNVCGALPTRKQLTWASVSRLFMRSVTGAGSTQRLTLAA